MFAGVSAVLGLCMILFVAVQGLQRHAQMKQRLYTAATGTWTAFGFVLYHPAGMMRWVPHTVVTSHSAQGLFAFGVILLGITGVCLLIGD